MHTMLALARRAPLHNAAARTARGAITAEISGVRRSAPCSCACSALTALPAPAASAAAAAFSTLLLRSRPARSASVLLSSAALCSPLAAAPPVSSVSPSSPTRGLKEWANSKLGSPLRRMRHGLVEIPAYVTADHLAHLLNKTLLQLSKDARRLFDWWPSQTERAMKKEMYATAKDIVLSYDEAKQLAEHYRRTPMLRDLSDAEWTAERPFGPSLLQQRPPVIAILGHKDHGKTTLLDRLRGANVAAKEEFGITQETYAFHVDLDPLDLEVGRLVKVPFVPGKHRTAAARGQAGAAASAGAGSSLVRVPFSFLDTPGHVSFSEMRQTVSSVCDAILLVVAADEGVLDQTFETLRLARNLQRPLIVVINKMDLPGSKEKAARIRRELQDLGAKLHPPTAPKVSPSGDVVVVETSALMDRTGFRSLKQALLGVANALPLEYDAHYAPAHGTVIESMVLPGRGNLVRVNLQQGTLHRGDYFVAEGVFEGRVKDIRAMRGGGGGNAEDDSSENGLSMTSVGAGYTVDVMGCISLPNPGASFVVSSCKEQAVLQALVGRNAIKYKDQERVVARGLPEDEEEQGVAARRRPNLEQEGAPDAATSAAAPKSAAAASRSTSKQPDAGAELTEADDAEIDEVEEEEEYDEVEQEVTDDTDAAPSHSASTAAAVDPAAVDADDRTIDADEVPVDLDPRGRVAPPLPPRASWELSPPPPPAQRAMPLANLRPQFKFYTVMPDASAVEAGSQSRNAASPIALPDSDSAEKRFGLTVLLKTQNMGALNMLRASIEDMNSVNAARGLPSIHVSYSAAGDLTKRDLVTAESDGCWVYCFRTARPNKLHIQLAKQRHIPLFSFRHHQHLLDHLQHHIEMSPELTATGEAKLEQKLATNTRRSHHTVQ